MMKARESRSDRRPRKPEVVDVVRVKFERLLAVRREDRCEHVEPLSLALALAGLLMGFGVYLHLTEPNSHGN